MTNVSARSILVNFCPEKNLTPNGPKPIGVLTRTKSSHSDLRIPYCYLLSNFQPNWSNFFAPPPPPPGPEKKGVDTLGGLRPPPGGLCQKDFDSDGSLVLCLLTCRNNKKPCTVLHALNNQGGWDSWSELPQMLKQHFYYYFDKQKTNIMSTKGGGVIH